MIRRLYLRIRVALMGAWWGLRRGEEILRWRCQGPRQLHVIEILSGIEASARRLATDHYDPIDSTYRERANAAAAALEMLR